jgi:hypothetical protein
VAPAGGEFNVFTHAIECERQFLARFGIEDVRVDVVQELVRVPVEVGIRNAFVGQSPHALDE